MGAIDALCSIAKPMPTLMATIVHTAARGCLCRSRSTRKIVAAVPTTLNPVKANGIAQHRTHDGFSSEAPLWRRFREESIGDLEANETHIQWPQCGWRSRIAGGDDFDVRLS
jgi:hypothetical protein